MTSDLSIRIERALRELLEQGIEAGTFAAATACVGTWERTQWTFVEAASGSLGTDRGPADHDSIYDLASLTKPFVATTALRLHQSGAFALDSRVGAVLPEAQGFAVADRSWEEVLSHRAGLEAWVPFYESMTEPHGSAAGRTRILQALLPHWDPSTVGAPVYSDLGYILVGFALERVTGHALDALVSREVTRPLGIHEGVFYGAARPDDAWKARCASTGYSKWRGRVLVGEVHDDNCAALGGIAGHAGMFGRAREVAHFGAAQIGALEGRRGALEEEAVRHAVARRPGGPHRLGWDGKAEEGSAAGSRIDDGAFGHLGFTGTSLWCDPSRQIAIVLLTNRVAVSDDNAAIRAFRPRFHDAVVEAFDGF